MTDNTITDSNGSEIYLHEIYRLVDEYIYAELDGDKSKVNESFLDMIFYISDRTVKPSTENIELLDDIFNIYIRLCAKYKVLPSLEVFSFLVKINRSTFADWRHGRTRLNTKHSTTVQKWFDICKGFTVNRLHNKGGTDANLIFAAKAAYGMAETAPVMVDTIRPTLTAADLPRLQQVESPQIEDKSN